MLTVEQAKAILDGNEPGTGGYGSEFEYEQTDLGVEVTLIADWAVRGDEPPVVLLIDITPDQVRFRDEARQFHVSDPRWKETVREEELSHFLDMLTERASGLSRPAPARHTRESPATRSGEPMPQPAGNDKVHIIVTQKPNRVWAICNDEIHFARWRTTEGNRLKVVTGNCGLLNAAMLAWDGQNAFSLTFAELEERSQGWGAWD